MRAQGNDCPNTIEMASRLQPPFRPAGEAEHRRRFTRVLDEPWDADLAARRRRAGTRHYPRPWLDAGHTFDFADGMRVIAFVERSRADATAVLRVIVFAVPGTPVHAPLIAGQWRAFADLTRDRVAALTGERRKPLSASLMPIDGGTFSDRVTHYAYPVPGRPAGGVRG